MPPCGQPPAAHTPWTTLRVVHTARSATTTRFSNSFTFPERHNKHTSKWSNFWGQPPSRRLQEEYPSLGKRYWGRHLWARGYFCATVGTVTDEVIKRYIEGQRWEDDGGKGFRIVEEG